MYELFKSAEALLHLWINSVCAAGGGRVLLTVVCVLGVAGQGGPYSPEGAALGGYGLDGQHLGLRAAGKTETHTCTHTHTHRHTHIHTDTQVYFM